jgi:hypothetical protein
MRNLESKLVVGTKIKLGLTYCKEHNCAAEQGEIIELIEGFLIMKMGYILKPKPLHQYGMRIWKSLCQFIIFLVMI